MKTPIVEDKVYYTGVNDRTTARFEGLWPLPNGVSYNSYLIKGADKVAIIDGVEVSHALEQIDLIRSITPDHDPDYLIINHMEPDHSGGISILRSAFPNIRIVGNTQTLNMVKGYHGLTDGTLCVKDGDTLELGGATLRFFLTPMVHWPETMMTYLEEQEMLFSGDAFGCFGALNGAVVDTEMNTDRYFPEMIRYYSNIVGKYGAFVQRALRKLDSLKVGTICPTHGPVWHKEVAKVVDLYDRLSRYEPLDNGVTIVYGSMYGNTARMAEAAADALAGAGVRDITVHNASCDDLSYILADIFTHRGLVIASPTYSETVFPPVGAVLEAMKVRGIKDRKVVILGSHTWAQKAIGVIEEGIQMLGMEAVSESVNGKHAPSADILAQCAAAAKALAESLKD